MEGTDMLESYTHTVFVVHDLESSVRFYRDVLGLDLVSKTDNRGVERLARVLGFSELHLKVAALTLGGDVVLELLEYVHPPGKDERIERNDLGAAHLAFLVRDIDELYERTSTKGLRFINPPTPAYEGGKVVRKSSYAQDPDGNWLEFIERL